MSIKIKDQNGFVLPMVLMITVVFLILAIGLLPNVTAQLRFASLDQDRLRAQYAAEAGAKVAIRQIDMGIDDLKTKMNNTPANVGAIHNDGETSNGTPSYTVEYTPDSTSNPSQFNITSTGSYNGKQYTTRVIYALQNSSLAVSAGGVVDLFDSSCNYSRNQVWTLDKTSDGVACVNPPSDDRYQVLFKGSALDDNFTLSYNAACQEYNSNNIDGCGYGIFYGATGNADNMTSYVFQWDPAAIKKDDDLGSFFVKKIKMTDYIPGNPNNNEWHWEKVRSRKWSWSGSDWIYEPASYGGFGVDDYSADGGDGQTYTCVPFQKSASDECNVPGTTRVSIKKLKEYMLSNGKVFDEKGRHNIKIQVSKDAKGYHQIISCDGLPILDFYDNSTDLPITFKGSYAGLRVWNSKVCFYNDPNIARNVVKCSTIIWRK